MFTRITQCMLVATLGAIFSVVTFSGTVGAEGWQPPVPDITLASPPEVEAPATMVLSAPYPDVEVGGCSRVGTAENCYPYLVGRSGPDANGRYLSEWQLPMAPVGAIEIGVSANSFGTFGTRITFTVTGNRFKFTDFRSCTVEEFAVDPLHKKSRGSPGPVSRAIADYYAQVDTSLTYQLQQKVRTKTHHWRWATVKKYKAWEFPIAHSELGEGYGPYERRETKQNVPQELFYLRKGKTLYPRNLKAPKYRVVYFVKQGKKLLKRGVVSRKPCRKIDDPPYYVP